MFKRTAFYMPLAFGVIYWFIDAAIDAIVLDLGTFWQTAFTAVNPLELAFRAVVLGLFVILGVVGAVLSNRFHITRDQLMTMTQSALDAIIVLDGNGRIISWNPSSEAIFGYRRSEVIGKNLHSLLAPKRYHNAHQAAFPKFQQSGQGRAIGTTLELEGIRKGGEEFPISLSLSSMKVGREWHAVGIVRDISAQKEAEQKLEQLARHDPLTGLFNRHAFQEFLGSEVVRSSRYKHPIGLLMVDVNHFKEINDTHGHSMGDAVLIAVAELLQQCIRGSDIAVRFGGDEFLIMLLETNGETDVVVDRIRAVVAERNRNNPLLEDPVTLAIGAGHWDPDTGVAIETVLAQVDAAMYEDKAAQG